jgi:hypothetical protein
MTDTDLLQPDPGSLRAAAEAAELAQAVSGLFSIDGCRLADSDPLAPLARDIARSTTEAGLSMHHCAQYGALYRLGGACLLAIPAESGTGGSGIAVSWTTHNLLPDWDRYGTYSGTQQAMNSALGDILAAFGDTAEPFGSGGAWLVTGRRDRDAGHSQCGAERARCDSPDAVSQPVHVAKGHRPLYRDRTCHGFAGHSGSHLLGTLPGAPSR